MTKKVVSTIQELKAVQKRALYPHLVISGELANNLLASGLVTFSGEGDERQGLVTRPEVPTMRGPIYEVYDILRELSTLNRLEVVDFATGPVIRISPNMTHRKEGN